MGSCTSTSNQGITLAFIVKTRGEFCGGDPKTLKFPMGFYTTLLRQKKEIGGLWSSHKPKKRGLWMPAIAMHKVHASLLHLLLRNSAC